ncbi:hypothetical protein A2U01_0072950, partial [Trifolium medium]|nr:hypothetical protein [Trifolium medium]
PVLAQRAIPRQAKSPEKQAVACWLERECSAGK